MTDASHPPAPVARTAPGFVEAAGELTLLFLRAVGAILRGPILLRETLQQMAIIGVSSIPLAVLTIAFSGGVLSLNTANQLKNMGADWLLGGIVAVGMARELAPVLTSVVVAARVGSAIAAEIGTMVVTEQVEALRSLGVSPISYLVVPRLLAAVLMLPVLTIFANAAGVLGGYLVAVFGAHIDSHTFLNSAREMLHYRDLYLGLAKTFAFGAIIAVVGCSQGLRTTGGAAGVGKSTTAAVVSMIVLVYAADYFLSEWMFGAKPSF